MRTFEITVILFAILNVIFFLWKRKRNSLSILSSFILVLLLVIQIVIEGYRWQLVPVTILSLFIFLYRLVGRQEYKYTNRSQKKLYVICKAIIVLWLIVSVLLPVIVPLFKLPLPTGQYQVGTQYLVFVDSTRSESFLPEKNLYREIPVQIYYPANPQDFAQKESYWSDATEWSKAWMTANGYGWFSFFWSHLKYVKTHTCPDSPILANNERYPVMLFSHGYWQFSKFNTSLLTELASHGYVVVSISHNHESPLSVYPDGSIKTFSRYNPEFMKGVEEYRNLYSAGTIFQKISKTNNEHEIISLYREFYELVPYTRKSNAIWVEDTQFCIDQLELLNSKLFHKRLDLGRIGVAGFSFGGCVAGLMALQDERIKAGVNLDGWQYGHTLGKNLTCPFMFISSEGHGWHSDFFFDRAEGPVYDIVIKNTKHANFNDMALALPVPGKLLGRLGKIDCRYGNRLINYCVSTFFNLYLKNQRADSLKNLVNKFPEIEIKTKNLIAG